MANVTITQLPAAGPIQGDELVPIVQNGQTVRSTTAAVAGSPVQTQTFITLNQEPTLNNSRALAGGTGIGLVDNGAQSTLQVTLNGASGSLEAASNGVIVKTGASTVTNRSIAVSGTGLSITDGDGVSGNPTVALDGLISAVAQVGGTGLLAIQNGTTAGGVLIAGTANEIDVTDGDGQGGNPTISISDNPIIPGTGGMRVPGGTTAQQPPGANGTIRYNSDTGLFEGFSGGSWTPFSVGGGVTSFSAGSTGLTPSVLTVGAITLGGTLNVANGGTGATSLTGYLVGNGASAITTVATIPNAGLTNSAVTYNGVTVALGSSGTITAASPQALTIGTGLSGGSYNGSSAVTVAIDSTVATLTGTQTLTNKSISGATNTLSSIPNAALDNSSVTIGTTNVSLGGTSLTLGGLTSVAVTQDPVSALQVATKQYVDTLVSSGITYHAPVKYEVPSTTGNLNATYNNGVSGVGATLTNAGTLAAFAPDGPTASPGDRVLIYNQTNAFENGVYTVTVVGNGSTPWVLTRATDADSYGLKDPNALGEGDAFFVQSGNTGAGETYVCNTTGVITFGTTAITFAQVSASQVYSAGTGLTLSGTQFSLTVPVAATNGGTGLTSFTANGIPYANSTTTLTTGSALTFDGTTLTTTNVKLASGGSIVDGGGNAVLTPTSGGSVALTSNGAYTNGNIVYNALAATGVHVFSVNSAEQMRLTSTGLGIGTTSPAYKLDVVGTAAISGGVTLSGGTANGVAYLDGSKVLTTGSALTFDGTNTFTVATSVPTIAINGTAASGTGARGIDFQYNGASYGDIRLNVNSGELEIVSGQTGQSGYFQTFKINGSEQMRLTSTGLGIGTSSPVVKLDVNGAMATSASGGSSLLFRTSGTTNYSWANQYPAAGNFSLYDHGAGATVLTVNSGNLGIGTSSPAQKLHVSGASGSVFAQVTSGSNQMYMGYANGIGSTIQSNNLLAFYTGASYTQNMVLDSSGNLGLGVTPSAGVKLQLSNGELAGWAGTSGYLVSNTYYGSGDFRYVGTGAAARYQQVGGVHAWLTAPSGTAGNAISFTQAMTLDASGNLGIGTSSPGAKLEVSGSGNQNLIVNSTSSSSYMQFANSGGITGYIGSSGAINSGGSNNALGFRSQNEMVFATGGSTERMRLDSSGNLGLGVTPSAWGSLWKASQVVRSHFADYNSGAYLSMGHNAYESSGWKYIGTGNATLYQQSSGQHIWLTASSGTAGNAITFTQAMTLDASGNLGIGTTSPYSTLAVSGNITLQKNASNVIQSYTGSAYTNLSYDAAIHVWATSGTERARITSAGSFVAGGSVALATTATDGFLYVPTCAGTPTGTPTAITGMAPIVVDTTNNKLYFYSGGAWRDAGP